METALGYLGWSPSEFWSSTPHELMAAIDGWNKAHGEDPDKYMTREDLEDLMQQYPDEKVEPDGD